MQFAKSIRALQRSALFCCTALAAGACFATGAFAAQGADSAQPAPSTDLQEVVVTAQKRTEKLVDVPMSISVVSAQTAKNRGIYNIQDLGQAVAGVDISYGGFAVQPSIRGVTSSDPLLENNVTVYLDGFYQNDQNTINAEFANLQSVQILKGPQGTLYGRNATGGAILYTTTPPSDTLTGSLEGGYGNYNTWRLNGFLSGPIITDRLLFSVAGSALNSDGYYTLLNAQGQGIGNAAPIRSYSLRTKLQANLTDNFKATLGYNYTELTDARGDQFTPESDILFGSFFTNSGLPPQVGRLYQPYTGTFAGTQQFDAEHEAQLTLVYRTPIGTLTSHTGEAFRTEKDNFQFGDAVILTKYFDRNFQESLDFDLTAIDHLDLTIGGTYYHDNNHLPQEGVFIPALATILPDNGLVETEAQELYTSAYAFFAQGAYHVTDRLTLSAGIRYSDEEKSEYFKIDAIPALLPANNHANFPNFSPQGSIRYKFAPGSEAYVSITDGFRSGQVQIFAGPSGSFIFAPVKPEKITSYEVGYKLDRRTVQFTTAGFYYNYTDLQQSVTLPNPGNPSQPISFVSNAPKATIYGVEGEINWAPIHHLGIDVSADWLHARFGSFPAAAGIGLDAATETNISPQTQDLTGQRMYRSPDFSATFAVNYDIEDVFGGSLTPEANVKVTTKYVINDASLYGPLGPPGLANTQRFYQPGYALANASLTWTDPTKHYHVSAYVDNLSGTMYRLDYAGTSFGNINTWAWPRTYGFRLGAKF